MIFENLCTELKSYENLVFLVERNCRFSQCILSHRPQDRVLVQYFNWSSLSLWRIRFDICVIAWKIYKNHCVLKKSILILNSFPPVNMEFLLRWFMFVFLSILYPPLELCCLSPIPGRRLTSRVGPHILEVLDKMVANGELWTVCVSVPEMRW